MGTLVSDPHNELHPIVENEAMTVIIDRSGCSTHALSIPSDTANGWPSLQDCVIKLSFEKRTQVLEISNLQAASRGPWACLDSRVVQQCGGVAGREDEL